MILGKKPDGLSLSHFGVFWYSLYITCAELSALTAEFLFNEKSERLCIQLIVR